MTVLLENIDPTVRSLHIEGLAACMHAHIGLASYIAMCIKVKEAQFPLHSHLYRIIHVNLT